MRCPDCGRFMEKVLFLDNTGAYYYYCCHCEYTTEILENEKTPLGDNYAVFANEKEDWEHNKKKLAEPILKKEHKKIIDDMYKKLGNITDDDKIDLEIWFWEVERGKETLK